MQTVYEIVQDDMPLNIPLFTDLERARHEMNAIVQQELIQAKQSYHDAYIWSAQGNYDCVTGDVQYIMACHGQLEYSAFAIYRRDVNTATMGESRS